MANTLKINGNMWTLSGLDTDWTLASSSNAASFDKGGIKVTSITYMPGTSTGGDKFILYNEASSGAVLFKETTYTDSSLTAPPGAASITRYYNGYPVHPVLTSSDCIISAGSLLTFELA